MVQKKKKQKKNEARIFYCIFLGDNSYMYTFFDRVLILHQGDASSSAAGGGATTAGGATLSVDLVVVSFRLSMIVVEKDFTIS